MDEKKFKILIVDEQLKSVEFLKAHLLTEDYEVTGLTTGAGVLKTCSEEKFDLLLLSINLSDINGLEVCKKIKSNKEMADLPVIFITSHREIQEKLDALEVGAQDFITKPFNMDELKARVKVALRVKHSKDVLKNRTTQLEGESLRDELTNLFNRRYIKERMYEEVSRAARYKDVVSCIIFDLDQFKSINRAYGYEAGDAILRDISEVIRENVRSVDIVGRYGGEEFVIILPQTNLDGAFVVAEKLSSAIKNKKIKIKDEEVSVTVSMGVASTEEADGDDLLYYADTALNTAKLSDKIKVVAWKKEK